MGLRADVALGGALFQVRADGLWGCVRMGNHTATRARSGRGARRVRESAPSSARWRGGGQPMGDAVLRPPRASSPRPTVYASAAQRAAVHQEARALVGEGIEHAVAFDTTGKRFFEQAGNHEKVDIPPEVLARMGGQSLLHNHPRGNSLSPADVQLGAYHEMTMHVVGRVGGRANTRGNDSIVLYTMRYAPLPAGLNPQQRAFALGARAIRLDEMTKVMEAEIESAYTAAIRANQISARDASAAFFHQVWNAVADAFPGDVSYSWEVLSPAAASSSPTP